MSLRLLICFFSLFLISCAADTPTPPEDYGLGNTIFSGSAPIEINTPVFADTVDVRPTFTWIATGQKNIFIGVFTSNLIVREGSIINTSKNIWSWHSGLSTGREGNIRYTDGRNVCNGEILDQNEPLPLLPDRGYIWAIWAWNDEGTEITHSSEEMFFRTKSMDNDSSTYEDILDRWIECNESIVND